MSGVLLDTNLVSEMTRTAPDTRVVDYLTSLPSSFLSVVTVLELQYGVARKPRGRRRSELTVAIDRLLSEYGDALLDIDRAVAALAGTLRATEEASGRTLHVADALIAATARVHELTLATRNVRDFEHLGIAVVNPWD